MLADVGEAEGHRIGDRHPEDATAARQIADRFAGLGIDATGDEALQIDPVGVEHPERRVTSTGQLAGDLERTVHHDLLVELGDQAAPDLDELPKPVLVQDSGVGRHPQTKIRSANPASAHYAGSDSRENPDGEGPGSLLHGSHVL